MAESHTEEGEAIAQISIANAQAKRKIAKR